MILEVSQACGKTVVFKETTYIICANRAEKHTIHAKMVYKKENTDIMFRIIFVKNFPGGVRAADSAAASGYRQEGDREYASD